MHALPDEGAPPDRHRRRLFWLLVANVVASILHYGDNVMFFLKYPEPLWINTRIIDGFSLRIHAFILFEAVLAVALIGYVAVIQIGHASGSRMR